MAEDDCIRPLPPECAARVKSSTHITCLNGVILELLKNSLDAHARKVTVAVDYVRGNCSVEDNGLGIPPVEFLEDGGLDKLHRKA